MAALLVTHGHPDHYAGAARLLDGLDAPIVATAGVDATIGADFIAPTPTLVVHGRTDDFCSPTGAQRVHDRIDGGDRELRWLDTTSHIDLYDQPAYVDPAVDHVTQWMTEHL